MSGPTLLVIDAFSSVPFGGNPAAVCLLERPASEPWMQGVASETRIPETAFVAPSGEADGARELRWFTPEREVDLCGHATLASAHALWSEGLAPEERAIVFETASGRLEARRAGAAIELDFPAEPAEAAEPPRELSVALDVRPLLVARNRLDWLVELSSEEEVRSIDPDMRRLLSVEGRGVIVTAPADPDGQAPGADFVSRFFAPAVGVDEDPVTGSAHCALGPFWAERLQRSELVGRQLSERGGTVRVRLAGDRVVLGGEAVTVARGELLTSPPAG